MIGKGLQKTAARGGIRDAWSAEVFSAFMFRNSMSQGGEGADDIYPCRLHKKWGILKERNDEADGVPAGKTDP